MSATVPIVVCGAAGRMGGRIIALAAEAPDVEIVAAIETPDSQLVGRDAGESAGIGRIGVEIRDDYEAAAIKGTVTLDFTAPQASMANLEAAARTGAAIVVGTSGLSLEERERAGRLASKMPTMLAANMSLGVNVLSGLVAKAAAQLGADFDCEIVELHHALKADAPSGTALALAETAAAAKNLDPHSDLVLARQGMVGKRGRNEIGVVALRGGDAPGEHTVMFIGKGERLELTHRALSRDCLAAGAIRAARWLHGKPAGLYSMADLLEG
jgi:4-hydroxy-tetrahydrodipicolinate reductase